MFSNVILFYLMGEINNGNSVKQQMAALQEKRKVEKEYNIALKNSYDKQRAISHDFNNNLLAIKNIADVHDIQALKTYISKLLDNVEKNKLVVKSNNTVVDAILNQKYTEAYNKGIYTEYNISDLSNAPIAPDDIVTILANALDNAIAAAERSVDKKIKARFTYLNDETIIMISNSVKENVNIINNNICTTKADNISHGYGIKNIQFAIEKYNPVFLLECENLIFSLTILI